MSKEIFYRQCHLEKKTKTGVMHQTSYLPEPFCEVGKIVKLRDDDGVWDDGWKVATASSNKYPEKFINEQSRQYLKNRLATDI